MVKLYLKFEGGRGSRLVGRSIVILKNICGALGKTGNWSAAIWYYHSPDYNLRNYFKRQRVKIITYQTLLTMAPGMSEIAVSKGYSKAIIFSTKDSIYLGELNRAELLQLLELAMSGKVYATDFVRLKLRQLLGK